ncbi:phosphate ABC transporter substrate-binding protein PstS [Marinilabiliaceae bacterium ANBcel2]|nr:phosphate ABC transporter substrate-binding protein PstS [Marinilabiliaceae bacterium ANBcel2]
MKRIKMIKSIQLFVLFSLSLLVVSCGGRSDSSSETGSKKSSKSERITVLGAGASFPAPLVTAMADDYRDITNNRVTVNYQSIGSGGGVRQFVEQTIMFGMTEAFLSDEVIANIEQSTQGKAFNMPITLADVVATYNIPGVDEQIVFNSELLVNLFLGNITSWDDPRIAEINPDIDFPSIPVTIVHRSDGSGTTNIWTSYLSSVSKEWRDRIGFATSVNWPVGVGGNGNEGVAGAVMNSPGALGYNSLSYALLNDMDYAAIINSSGNIIEPSYEATTAAADIDLPADTRVLFTNTPAPDGYPVAGFAWMLVYENLEKNNAINSRKEAVELVKFLIWTITDGQNLSEDLGYARLPQAAVDRNFEMIRQIKWEGEKIGEELLKAAIN